MISIYWACSAHRDARGVGLFMADIMTLISHQCTSGQPGKGEQRSVSQRTSPSLSLFSSKSYFTYTKTNIQHLTPSCAYAKLICSASLFLMTFYFILGNLCVCPGPLSVTNYGWHRLESNWGRRSVVRTVGGQSVVRNIKFVTNKQLGSQCALSLLLIDSRRLVTW